MDGLWWKILIKWMIWKYPYFWKYPYLELCLRLFEGVFNQSLYSYQKSIENIERVYTLYIEEQNDSEYLSYIIYIRPKKSTISERKWSSNHHFSVANSLFSRMHTTLCFKLFCFQGSFNQKNPSTSCMMTLSWLSTMIQKTRSS